MCVMDISVTYGTWMISTQLWFLPRSSSTLGILCMWFGFVIVQRVGLLETYLRLVFTPIPTSLSSSLTLLVIGGRLITEVLL